MSADTDDLLGRRLENGRYEIRSLLGKGGMGAAYRARDARLGTDVVLKVPQREALARPGARQRFEREVRAMIRLSHPHIVKVIDLGEHDGLPFVIMQYRPGGPLDRQMCDRDGRPVALPAEGLWAWLPDVADALDYVHGERHLHRDVKPSNILLDAKGKAFLSDFGMVKAVEDGSPLLTHSGQMPGTIAYMAPEIGGKNYDGRIDQYALAVTVYEWLCGRRPFDGTPREILIQHAVHATPPPRQWAPGLPEAIEQALLRALAKDPARRFPNCGSFAGAVLSAAPAPVRTRPTPAIPNLEDSSKSARSVREAARAPASMGQTATDQVSLRHSGPRRRRFWATVAGAVVATLLIAALSVWIVAVALRGVQPPDWAVLGWKTVKDTSAKSVPIELEFERLKTVVANLRPNPKLLSDVARCAADVKELEKEIDALQSELTAREKTVKAMQDALKSGDQVVTFLGKEVSRQKLSLDLLHEIDLSNLSQTTLKRKEATLDANKKALKAGLDHLTNMKRVREEYGARLAHLEAEYPVLTNGTAENKAPLDSGSLARVKKAVAELRNRLETDERLKDGGGKADEKPGF